MRGTCFAGKVVGWLTVAGGAVLVMVALASDQSEVDWRIRSTVRVGIAAQGLSAMAVGIVFLLLAYILEALVDLRDDARAARARSEAASMLAARTVAPVRSAPLPARHDPIPPSPPAAPGQIGDPPSVPIPSRYDMMTRHGEDLGARAWELMRAAAKARIALPEVEAVRKAREQEGGPPGQVAVHRSAD